MIATTTRKKEMAVLMAATMLVAGISIAPFLGAEAQIAIKENGVGLVDQSNVEQTIVQVPSQEACTNESGEQNNDCKVDQTQTVSAAMRTKHDIAMNAIRNIR